MKAFKPSKCPVHRLITCNAGIFEMICKIVIISLIIPWGSIFLNGLIFDAWLNVVYKGNTWPVLIALWALLLFGLGMYFSVRAIVAYVTGTGRKRIENNKADNENSGDNSAKDGEEE